MTSGTDLSDSSSLSASRLWKNGKSNHDHETRRLHHATCPVGSEADQGVESLIATAVDTGTATAATTIVSVYRSKEPRCETDHHLKKKRPPQEASERCRRFSRLTQG
jgi:hypothetical protein